MSGQGVTPPTDTTENSTERSKRLTNETPEGAYLAIDVAPHPGGRWGVRVQLMNTDGRVAGRLIVTPFGALAVGASFMESARVADDLNRFEDDSM